MLLSKFPTTVLCSLVNLDKPLHMKAIKMSMNQCVEVQWNKLESGACFVQYDVKFKNDFGDFLYNDTGHNIREMKICNLTSYKNITEVQLTVSFKSASKTVTSKVVEKLIGPPTKLPQNMKKGKKPKIRPYC